MKIRQFMTLSLAGIAVLGMVLFAQSRVREVRAEPPGISLSQHAFPEGSTISEDRLITDENEPSHPLFRGEMPETPTSGSVDTNKPPVMRKVERKAQHNYESVRVGAANIPQQKTVVTNFTYVYANANDATVAAKAIRTELAAVKGMKPIKLEGGEAFYLVGTDGDEVYWFVGSKNTGLTLLLINGFDSVFAESQFESLVKKNAKLNADPVDEVR
jgi:hypothetical protein